VVINVEFYIGQRVMVNEAYDGNVNIVGKVGNIIEIDIFSVGIYFDQNVQGHNCSKRCEDGHGWYVNKKLIIPISTDDNKLIELLLNKKIDSETYEKIKEGVDQSVVD
jgi:hypothetical protein